jgi:hypothetical protein
MAADIKIGVNKLTRLTPVAKREGSFMEEKRQQQ